MKPKMKPKKEYDHTDLYHRLRLEAPGTGNLVVLDREGVRGQGIKVGVGSGDLLDWQRLDLLQGHQRVGRTDIDLNDLRSPVLAPTTAVTDDGTGRAIRPGRVSQDRAELGERPLPPPPVAGKIAVVGNVLVRHPDGTG